MTGRPRLICWLLAGLSVLVLATFVRDWAQVAPQTSLNRTSDFAGTYVAATLWREGRGSQIYDPQVEAQALRETGAPAGHSDIPFENPPAALLAALPTTLVDGGAAWALWSWLQLLLVAAAVALAARAAPWPARAGPLRVAACLVALAGTGTALLFLEGQWDGFAVLGLAAAYWMWRRDRGFAAGLLVALGIGVAKPHLALGLAAFVIGRRDWRASAGALTGAVALLLANVALVGAAGVGSWVAALLRPSINSASEMLGFSGLFGSSLGPGRLTDLLTIAGGAAALAGAFWVGARTRRRPELLEPALFAATAFSLLASPHLLGHDLSLLAPVLVALLGWLAVRTSEWPDPASGAVLVAWIALSALALVDLAGQQSAGTGIRVVPLALICLGSGTAVAVIRGTPVVAVGAGAVARGGDGRPGRSLRRP